MASIREEKERIEAARIRAAILQGYQDVITGRIVQYRGNLRELLKSSAGPPGLRDDSRH